MIMNLEPCPRCEKVPPLCMCDLIPSLKTKLQVLILQHPQEPDKDLGTARLAHLALPNSSLKIGLSWPNLKAALGREVQPARWAVLYLGSGIKKADPSEKKKPAAGKEKQPAAAGPKPDSSSARISAQRPVLQFVNKQGVAIPAESGIEGIVILDGTWSQAKALWWRNAWLLKLKRAVLQSPRKSLYGELRREPRRECLSTLESIAESLVALGEPAQTGDQLRAVFEKLLEKRRQMLQEEKEARQNRRHAAKKTQGAQGTPEAKQNSNSDE